VAGHNDSWRAAVLVALGAALFCSPSALAEPAPGDPPAPPAPAEPWAGSCGLFQDAVTTASGALGPLRALPRDGSWNYDEPDVAHAVDLAEGSLSLAKGKASAASGVDGIPPQLRTLLDNYGYGVDYLLRALSGRKDNAVVQVYLGGYDKAVAEASGFCSPPPPAG
jgi:hypothetical protein